MTFLVMNNYDYLLPTFRGERGVKLHTKGLFCIKILLQGGAEIPFFDGRDQHSILQIKN